MQREQKSSITVFLSLIFLCFVLVVGSVVDVTRVVIVNTQAERALNSAMISTLAGYSDKLKSNYGLLFIDKDDSVLASEIKEYMKGSLNPEVGEDKGFNLYKYNIESVEVNYNLGDSDLNLHDATVLESQILDYMKVQAPIGMVEDILGAIGFDSIEDLMELVNNFAKIFNTWRLIDAKAPMDKAMSDLLSTQEDVYKLIYGDNFYAKDESRFDGDYINKYFDQPEYLTNTDGLKGYVEEQGWSYINWLNSGDEYAMYYANQIKTETLATLAEYRSNLEKIIVKLNEAISKLEIDTNDKIFKLSTELKNYENFLQTNGKKYFFDGVIDGSEKQIKQDRMLIGIEYNDGTVPLQIDKQAVDTIIELNENLQTLSNALTELDKIIMHFNNINAGTTDSVIKGMGDTAKNYDEILESGYIKIEFKKDFYEVEDPVLFETIRDSLVDVLKEKLEGVILFFNALFNPVSGGASIFNAHSPLVAFFETGGDWESFIKNTGAIVFEILEKVLNVLSWVPGLSVVVDFVRLIVDITKFVYSIIKTAFGFFEELIDGGLLGATDMFLKSLMINFYSIKTFKSASTVNSKEGKLNLEGVKLNKNDDRLQYELEYLLFGDSHEMANARAAKILVFATRIASNVSYMFLNSAAALGTNVVAGVLCAVCWPIAPFFAVVKTVVACVWGVIESVVEMGVMLTGGKVSLLKVAGHGKFYTGIEKLVIGTMDDLIDSVGDLAFDQVKDMAKGIAMETTINTLKTSFMDAANLSFNPANSAKNVIKSSITSTLADIIPKVYANANPLDADSIRHELDKQLDELKEQNASGDADAAKFIETLNNEIKKQHYDLANDMSNTQKDNQDKIQALVQKYTRAVVNDMGDGPESELSESFSKVAEKIDEKLNPKTFIDVDDDGRIVINIKEGGSIDVGFDYTGTAQINSTEVHVGADGGITSAYNSEVYMSESAKFSVTAADKVGNQVSLEWSRYYENQTALSIYSNMGSYDSGESFVYYESTEYDAYLAESYEQNYTSLKEDDEEEGSLTKMLKGLLDVKVDYDQHLFFFLFAIPNKDKLDRIQDVINHNSRPDNMNDSYLLGTRAGIQSKVTVRTRMMFLDWEMFRNSRLSMPFGGGYKYEVDWFQLY